MYNINFFTSPNKISPIQEFLDLCQPKLRTKILRQFKYIEEYGLSPAIPNLKKIINTRLWELRILGKDNIRILCVSLKKQEIMILHIFRKKSQKTPVRELNIAVKRCENVLDN
jgi:phage-related protein